MDYDTLQKRSREISSSPICHLSDPETWVDAYSDCLFGNALLRLRSRELAEEIVQETLLAAFESRFRFSGRSTERTWLIGILKHKVVDYFRKVSREERYAEEGSLVFETEDEWKGYWRFEEGKEPIDWGATPIAALERKEFWEMLHGCLAQLPTRIARAFVLREIDGLKNQEICRILGVTTTNLNVMLYRCRMQLRRCIERKWFSSKP